MVLEWSTPNIADSNLPSDKIQFCRFRSYPPPSETPSAFSVTFKAKSDSCAMAEWSPIFDRE